VIIVFIAYLLLGTRKKAFPKNGWYEIYFGKSVNYRITVDGSKVGTVYVDGRIRYDVYCK